MLRKTAKRKLACEIYEYYQHAPSIGARKVVENLLWGVPEKYLEDISAIVLCDTHSFKEQYGAREKAVAGRYCKTKDGGPPWIEICVDKVVKGHGKFLKVPIIRDMVFSDVLYHEIGHHIQRTQPPDKKEDEQIAERWRKKLQSRYLIRKHWYVVIPLLIIFLSFRKFIEKKLQLYRNESNKA